ncbi:MAG: peroxiredoxin [Planctomycetota bacterium]|nr:peroxiredoxin [Planctomycetota bacterium]GIK52690.1 MAG: peroxiredoxin [Planctomycetota bacterium]
MFKFPGLGGYHPQPGARVGDVAPDFTLLDAGGKPVSLKELLGERPLVLAFFPRANTPVCTAQMCSLRDADSELARRAHVLGISYSDPATMRRFSDKLHLPMTLLCDTEKRVARLYGVYGFLAPARVTFILDRQGVIRAVIERVTASSHAAQVLKALDDAGL